MPRLIRRVLAPAPKDEKAARGDFVALQRLVQWFNEDATPPQILCLGDSVYERVARHNTDQTPLGQMLCEALAPVGTARWISHSAYQSRVYFHLLRALMTMRHQPRQVILPINLRSFVPQWDLNPEWRFDAEIEALQRFENEPSSADFSVTPHQPTPAEIAAFEATPCEYSHTTLKTVGEFRKVIASKPVSPVEQAERRRQIFVYHAMQPLHHDHAKLDFWRETARLLQRHHISALFYVLPVNVEAGVRHLGNDFRAMTEANADVVKQALAPFVEKGALAFRDFSSEFESAAFFHEDEPTEHLCAAGRRRLASIVAQASGALRNKNDL